MGVHRNFRSDCLFNYEWQNGRRHAVFERLFAIGEEVEKRGTAVDQQQQFFSILCNVEPYKKPYDFFRETQDKTA